jgi:hypothetical protein
VTVGELRKALEGVPDDRLVLVFDAMQAYEIAEAGDDGHEVDEHGDETERSFVIEIDRDITEEELAATRAPARGPRLVVVPSDNS